MDKPNSDWITEIDRRAKVYEATEDEGRMTAIDYLGLAGLVLVLTVGLWIWVA